MHDFDVTDIKDVSISTDGKHAKIMLETKYIGDMGINLPVSCLSKLQISSALPRSESEIAAVLDQQEHQSTLVDQNKIAVSVITEWLTAADKARRVVVIVTSPQSAKRSGFAINQQGAKELAAALVRQADALERDDDG